MKNQTKITFTWLAMAAVILTSFSSCHKHHDDDAGPLTTKEISITKPITGIIIQGPWEVTVTQADANNSAWIEYNVSESKIKAEQRPNGVLFIKVSNLHNYNNRTLHATVNAALLEQIDASGAAKIYTYGPFNCYTEISLSGASHLEGFLCEGAYSKISLSGASKLKKFTFTGDYLDADLSGASHATIDNLTLEDNCKVFLSGASKFTASGYAEKTDFDGSGASDFKTLNLESENLDIQLSGASLAEATINNTITGALTGASTLKYRRAEHVNVHTSGNSKIIRLD